MNKVNAKYGLYVKYQDRESLLNKLAKNNDTKKTPLKYFPRMHTAPKSPSKDVNIKPEILFKLIDLIYAQQVQGHKLSKTVFALNFPAKVEYGKAMLIRSAADKANFLCPKALHRK